MPFEKTLLWRFKSSTKKGKQALERIENERKKKEKRREVAAYNQQT